jgi:hypothetical protein
MWPGPLTASTHVLAQPILAPGVPAAYQVAFSVTPENAA